MMKLYYCSAPTGSGKTHAIEHRIAELVENGETVILIQPSIALASQTKRNIANRFPGVRVEVINSLTVSGSVSFHLLDYLARPYDGPHAIIVTWVSFVSLPYFDRPNRFHLICDEVPACYEGYEKRLPDNHRMISAALDVVTVDGTYGRLEAKDRDKLRLVAENRRMDEAIALVKPLAERIYRGRYQTFVDVKRYEKFLKGSSSNRTLRAFSMVNPNVFDGFRSVTIVGARAQETILFQWLSKSGVNFMEHTAIKDSLRYTEHENGHLIDFLYASESNWSLCSQKSDPSIRTAFEQEVMRMFGSSEYCWLDNKHYSLLSPLNEVKSANKLPHSSHGMNSYMHIDKVAILTALNYGPDQSRFLSNMCGIDRDKQKIAFDYHSTYQAYCRISVRDPANEFRKTIILPDRQNAGFQRELFPGSSLTSLNIDHRFPNKSGPKRIYSSNSERQRAYRERRNLNAEHKLTN